MIVDEGSSLTAGRAVAGIDADAFASPLCGAFGDDAAFPLTRTNQQTRTVMPASQNPGAVNLPLVSD